MEVKNSFIRRAIALAMCGVMAFSLTACSNDRGSSEDSSISNPITEPSSGTPLSRSRPFWTASTRPSRSTTMLWAG